METFRVVDALFIGIHLPVLPLWLSWVLVPHAEFARYLAAARWPFAFLAAIYVVLIGIALFVVEGTPGASMSSLRGVMAIFDGEWAALAGWCHYLCFDAFVGRWMVNDAGPSYRLVPVLLVTLFFGPAGLLLYLGLRPTGYWSGPGRGRTPVLQDELERP